MTRENSDGRGGGAPGGVVASHAAPWYGQLWIQVLAAMAAGVLSHMEFAAQVLWPELRVRFLSVSDQWAQMSIAGPKARAILQALVEDDLADAAFPFLAAREVRLKGNLKARLFRISFSGERAYEIAVPARYGDSLMRQLMENGRQFGAIMYGTEALSVDVVPRPRR